MTPETAAVPAMPRSAKVCAWGVLGGMGGTEMTYNIWHATHAGHMNVGLALLYGIAPVAAAVLLSHIVAEHEGGGFLKFAAFTIMLAAMSLSAYATAVVVTPAAGEYFRWVFGFVLDAAALIALSIILDGRAKKAAARAVLEGARSQVTDAAGRVAEARAECTRLASELDTAKAAHAAELAGVRDAHAAELAAELAAVKSELGGELASLSSALNKALNKVPSSPRNRASSSPRKPPAGSPVNPGPAEDIDTHAEALSILLAEPDISGGELGRRLGKSKRYGCILKAKLTGEQREQEDAAPGGSGTSNGTAH